MFKFPVCGMITRYKWTLCSFIFSWMKWVIKGFFLIDFPCVLSKKENPYFILFSITIKLSSVNNLKWEKWKFSIQKCIWTNISKTYFPWTIYWMFVFEKKTKNFSFSIKMRSSKENLRLSFIITTAAFLETHQHLICWHRQIAISFIFK